MNGREPQVTGPVGWINAGEVPAVETHTDTNQGGRCDHRRCKTNLLQINHAMAAGKVMAFLPIGSIYKIRER